MRFLPVALAAAVVLPSSVAAVAPASAATSTACVTRAEYRTVKKGMTLAQAQRAFGARGRLTSHNVFSDGDVWQSRDWKPCGSRYGYVQVDFVNGLVTAKHGLFI